MTQIITALSDISDRYDLLYCDLWGCLHNGQKVFPAAAAALRQFREGGGTVLLLTNSPRTRRAVVTQLLGMGGTADMYDDIATSGDAAQTALAAGLFGHKVHHIGPERDHIFFENEDGTPLNIERVPLEDADSVVLTGLFDDRTETPDDYELTLRRAMARDLKMLCANPDIMVDVGDRRIYCAGAIAQAYEKIGGTAYYFGKPHAPIYTLARQRGEAARGQKVEDAGILCIGDGILTDISGGMSEGLDTLFISGGLAAEETGTRDGQPDPEKLREFLDQAKMSATAAMGMLR
jgi:HAD superfamily hydrolase (TIGR01459 family)